MLHKKYFFIILAVTITGTILPYQNAMGMSDVPLNPDVFVSSDKLLQADTLLVVVKNEVNEITGNLGLVNLHFFRSQNNKDWIAIVGIAVNKKPDSYQLTIHVPGESTFEKDVMVSERNFPITPLEITPRLRQKGYTAKKIIKTVENKENKILNKILKVFTPKVYFTKPFSYPLSEINIASPYGAYGDIRQYKSYQIQHLGVDLKAQKYTPVYAVNDGMVVLKEENLPDYGRTIIIDHGLGMYSLYLHLDTFNVKKGQMVKQGDTIGLSGDTGYVTGPHLHFSIKVRGASIDPLKFIRTTQLQW